MKASRLRALRAPLSVMQLALDGLVCGSSWWPHSSCTGRVVGQGRHRRRRAQNRRVARA